MKVRKFMLVQKVKAITKVKVKIVVAEHILTKSVVLISKPDITALNVKDELLLQNV